MRKNQIQYTFQNSCQEKRSPNNCTCNKQSRPRQLTHDNETGKKRSGISASTHPQPIEHPKQTTHTTTETAAYFKQGQKREEDNGQDHRHRQDLIDRPTNELLATKPIRGTNVLLALISMPGNKPSALTPAQQELYDWLADYIGLHHHSPSIRQMMQAMGLRSPAPVQSRLRHLQQKGWITWKEGQARTLQLLGELGTSKGVPVLGAVAAGGLVETYSDIEERLDLSQVLETRGLFALTVNGDSMVDAHIADGDVVLMQPVVEPSRLKEGTVVSALVAGSGTTLKHFSGTAPWCVWSQQMKPMNHW